MINIQDITPFMKPGWVAMDENQEWFWFENKPKPVIEDGFWTLENGLAAEISITAFNIAPADDWTKSLIKVGEK